MTAEEIIAEVRLLASDMAIRGACPGEVSPSLQYRITDFLHRAGIPFAPWLDHRKYLTKTRTAICDGKEVPCQVHKAVVDDTAGEVCREIVQSLLLAKWDKLPASKDWTADRAEQAIRDAVTRLPELCDKLEATKSRDDEPPKPPAAPKGEGTPVEMTDEDKAIALARGEPNGKPAKGKRGRRKGSVASDPAFDQQVFERWAEGRGQFDSFEDVAISFGLNRDEAWTAKERHRDRLRGKSGKKGTPKGCQGQ